MTLYLHEISLFIGFKKDNIYKKEREDKGIKTQYRTIETQVSCIISLSKKKEHHDKFENKSFKASS